jgi:hypothetical protein
VPYHHMQPSIAGLIVCGGILVIALRFEVPLIVALLASAAFGSTAIASLPALGGSSPLVYVVFAAALIASVFLRRNSIREFAATCFSNRATCGVVILAIYVTAGSVLLPQIFAGETTVFVPQRLGGNGSIAEVPLAPVSGNVTQLAYFLLGVTLFFAFLTLLRRREAIWAVKQGFFTWTILHVGMGFLDLGAKLAGLKDPLGPIRSAAYAMLSNDNVAGFGRIAGGCAEASAFGAMSATLLAFMFTYWSTTKDRVALMLSLMLLMLLILSTSSTAYVASIVLLVYLIASLLLAALSNRLHKRDILLVLIATAGVCFLTGVELFNSNALEPFSQLLDATLIKKASSASGVERAYWNWASLQSAVDTFGLGVGIGSSRASSWVIAVISQMGVPGAVILGLLTLVIVRGPGRNWQEPNGDHSLRAVTNSVRAACLASLLTVSISGAEANPGLVFYIALAVTIGCRQVSTVGKARVRSHAPSFVHNLIGQQYGRPASAAEI